MTHRNAEASAVLDAFGTPLGFSDVGDGPPLLFIQGTGLHGDGWAPQIDDLVADHRCIWFDNRGMGRSPIGSRPVSIDEMARDALAVLDHLDLAQAHLIGHSLGGCIALAAALQAPDRVASLVLMCTSADGAGLTRMSLDVVWRGLRMQVGTRSSRRRAFLEMVLTDAERETLDLDAFAAEMEPLFGHDLAVTPPVVFQQVRAMSRWNVTSRLGEITAPTFVLGGVLDIVAKPALMRSLAAGIPHATVEWMSDGAHGLTVTRAAEVNAHLRAHIQRCV